MKTTFEILTKHIKNWLLLLAAVFCGWLSLGLFRLLNAEIAELNIAGLSFAGFLVLFLVFLTSAIYLAVIFGKRMRRP